MDIQDKTREELIKELQELKLAYDSLKVSAEKELLKSRKLFKSMETAAKIGGWEFDVETMVQTWTDEIFHILEIDTTNGAPDVPEGIGFIAPEYQPMALQGIQRAIEFGEPYNQEWEVITAKGNKRWINAIASPYRENGKTKTVSGSFQDITERKLVQEALRKSEENLSITLQSIGDGVISTDKNGLVVQMNPVAEKLCGWPLPEAKGKPLAEVFAIINAETRQTVADPVNKVFEKGEIVGLANHTVLVSRNGTEYQIADSAAPIKNKEGEITGVVLVFSDITETYSAQKQIKESEERYRCLLNSLEAGVVVHAPDTSIVMNNARASELLGLSDDQMRGKAAIDPAWKFIHEDNSPLALDEYPVNRIVNTRQSIKNQVLGILQPGKNDVVWVTVNGFPVLDAKGEITEVVISFIDISERKQAEHELQSAMETAEVNTARITAIIEGTANSIWAFNEKYEIVYVNQVFKLEFYQTFGIWLEPGTNLTNSLPEVIRPGWKKRYDRVLNNEQYTVEDAIDTENGIVYIQVTFNPIVKKGEVIGGSCFGSDITIRKLAEIELLNAKEQAEANEEKYRLSEIDMQEAQRLAHIGSWHWDLNTGLVSWSKELYNINGHNPDIPVPHFEDMAPFYTAESWKAINEAVAKTFNTGEPYNHDLEMIKPDGTVIFTNTRGCANYDDAGKLVSLHGTVQDITERKRLEGVHAFLSTSGYPGSNENFFESLAKYLATILDSEYVCIDKLEGDGLTAQTVAIYNEGKFDPNISYTLKETPCGEVVGKTICCFPANVCQLFPNDQALQELKAHSYIGTTLWSYIGKPVGLIAIIGQKPLRNAAFAENVLKLVTIRAAAELEREQAVRELKESEERFKNMFERHSSIMLLIEPESGRIIGANEASASFYGYSKSKLLTMRISEINMLSPEQVKIEREHAVHEERTYFVFPHRLASGELRTVEVHSSPIVFENHQILFSIIHDITERKHAEEALLKSEYEFRLLAESMPQIVWITRADGSNIFFNQQWVSYTGLSLEESYGDGWNKPFHPDDQKHAWDAWQNATVNMATYSLECRLRRFDGEYKWWLVRGVPIMDEDGTVLKWFGTCTDINELKNSEENLQKAKAQAEEADHLKSAFLANMSHEIRTPMNGILGFAEILKEPDLTGAEQQKYIGIIEKSGNRMLNIINDIIDISKIEAGLMKLDIKESNINEQIEYIYTFFKPEVEAKGMRLSFRNTLTAKEAIINTDREKLYAIFTNLVKNAIKYTNEGSIEFGYVLTGSTTEAQEKMAGKVGERSRTPELQFYIRDTGIGIPKNRQEAIFERFVQADIEDKKARQGAGLGLAITKSYIEMLGGKIWVESQEGIGSTFYFTLPYNPKVEEKAAVKNVDLAFGGDNQVIPESLKLKILIAEDDESSEMLIALMVKMFGKEIIKVRTGVEAVEVCKNKSDIDLVLMDIRMPEMGGYEATKQIRKFNKEVVIIAQTAYGLSGDREKAREAGCNDYIAKPVVKAELQALIQKYFGELYKER